MRSQQSGIKKIDKEFEIKNDKIDNAGKLLTKTIAKNCFCQNLARTDNLK